jgi:hypothetical protein
MAYTLLNDLLAPSPLSALVAAGLLAGFVGLGLALRRLLGVPRDAIVTAACIVAGVALVGAVVHALAWAGLLSLTALRVLAGAVFVASLASLASAKRRLDDAWPRLRALFAQADWMARVAIVCAAVIVVAMGLAALGPATDADSLDYHLGVPLDWLRAEGAHPREDWFHARLVGLGESLNLLGLAAGTDALGAVLQWLGFVLAASVLSSWGRSPQQRAWGAVMVFATPVIAFLVPTQKPQLLPAAATLIALAAIARAPASFGGRRALLVFVCVAFAMANKHSFLLSGSVVLCVAGVAAWRSGTLLSSTLMAALAALALVAPPLLRNLQFYGDPLSPMLERFRDSADPAVMGFAEHLRNYGGEVTLARLLRLPFDLVVPSSLGNAQLVLGGGVAGIVCLLKGGKETRWFWIPALVACALTVAMGQVAPRFFVEPYLWAMAAVVPLFAGACARALGAIFCLQALAVLIMASLAAATLFPGALRDDWRAAVSERVGHGVAEARWLDEILPRDARMVGDLRAKGLFPRPFVSPDPAGHGTALEQEARLLPRLRRARIDTLVIEVPDAPQAPRDSKAASAPRSPSARSPTQRALFALEGSRLDWLARCYGVAVGEPRTFYFATRNPFLRGRPYRLVVVSLDLRHRRCTESGKRDPAL